MNAIPEPTIPSQTGASSTAGFAGRWIGDSKTSARAATIPKAKTSSKVAVVMGVTSRRNRRA